MTARAALLASAVVVSLASADVVGAHSGGTTGYASIVADGDTVRYTLTLWPAAGPAPVAADVKRAHAGDADSRARLVRALRDKIAIGAQGNPCRPMPPPAVTPQIGDVVTLVVTFQCSERVRELSVRDDVFDVFGPDYHALARIVVSERTAQFAFAPDARATRVRATAAGHEHVASFVLLGVEHILTGYDHILFLAALVFGGGSPRALLTTVTAFTLAHSLTLAVAVLGWVALPERLVESVIAASIVWMALENVALRGGRSGRWLVTFVFGLVHGFGFASALEPLALPPWNLTLALVGFNTGIEAGQACVVGAVLPVLFYARRRGWELGVARVASAVLALIGAVWFVQRLMFA